MTEFRVLVATRRPAIRMFFAEMAHQGGPAVSAGALALSAGAIEDADGDVSMATVMVVDASLDPPEALEICRKIRHRRPALPICALFCCPYSATAPQLRAFVAENVASFLDFELSPEEALRALRGVARGEGTVRLHLTDESSVLLFAGESDENRLTDDDRRLLTLVAGGLTDQEIGADMMVSPHTVRHRIERLRGRVGARNRVQLAAWAARHDCRG
jgi:DNA-binding NarL/FixJ family response regulator